MIDQPDTAQDLLPVRMLNEFVYCPRLFHLMHVDGRWAENEYTLEGTETHRRVDRKDQVLPDPKPRSNSFFDDDDDAPTIARSVNLGSPNIGLIGKLDLVQTDG